MTCRAGVKVITYNNKFVRIFGTNDQALLGGTRSVQDPWFCGRDVCEILKYSDYRRSLFDHVEDENKKSLNEIGTGSNHLFNQR